MHRLYYKLNTDHALQVILHRLYDYQLSLYLMAKYSLAYIIVLYSTALVLNNIGLASFDSISLFQPNGIEMHCNLALGIT
jgi:hypothetical protein